MNQAAARTMVFLFDRALEPSAYETRWAAGTAPDRRPYGTEHVPDRWTFEYATASEPRRLGRIARFLHARLGFDVVRALANVRTLRSSDVVYCHTEHEYLAAAFVLLPWRRRPLLVGQTIWLFDSWEALPRWRRHLYRTLLGRVDLLVANATPNLESGRRLSTRSEHVYLPFGASRGFDHVTRSPGQPDVLSVGNDRARDWDTFAEAMDTFPDLTIRVASKAQVLVGERDVSRPTSTVAELRDLYGEADLLAAAVTENSYASGITAILEAVACRTPVIATRTGGLDDYFDDSEMTFVRPGSPAELARAVEAVRADPQGAAERADRARRRLDADGYWIDQYWVRVTDAAQALLQARGEPAARR
jgi:glycosyltransferase involved in cell wall biosynthesis